MADIYRYISFIFLFVHVLSLRTTVQRAADNVRITGLFRKGHTVRQGCVGPNATASRAREVTETLYEISGPGNSVNLGNSGHRVYPGRAQNNTIQLYLLSGKDGIHRDYHYVILQSRNMNFKYLCFNFRAVLTWPNHTYGNFSQKLYMGKGQKTTSLLLTPSFRCTRGIFRSKQYLGLKGL